MCLRVIDCEAVFFGLDESGRHVTEGCGGGTPSTGPHETYRPYRPVSAAAKRDVTRHSARSGRYGRGVNWGDVPTWVAAVIAAVAAWLSWRSSRRSKRAEGMADEHKGDALKAAQDAVAAEGRAATAAERSAAALEEQNRLAAEQADAAEGVPWRIEHSSGAKWALWNDSDRPKFSVRIRGPGVVAKRTPEVIDRIDGRNFCEFWGNTAWDGSEMRADVTWHQQEDSDEPPRAWSGTMPPRG